jgi:hypothetical protein
LAFVEEVGEELLDELYETPELKDEYTIWVDERIITKIGEILSTNEKFIKYLEELGDPISRLYIRNYSLCIQFAFIRITQNIVTKMNDSDDINQNMIDELLLVIFRIKLKEINEFITYFFTDDFDDNSSEGTSDSEDEPEEQ